MFENNDQPRGHRLYKLCRDCVPNAACKFEDHRTLGSGEQYFKVFYGHGGHFGHVTKTIFIKLCPLPKVDSHNICV